MNDGLMPNLPERLPDIEKKSREIGFTMPSDRDVGSLLRTLVGSKRPAKLLELGTGIGLSLCWMVDGMGADCKMTSIDNDPQLIRIAKQFFGSDQRVVLLCEDGSKWLRTYRGEKFDLIFADAWPGKYSETVLTLDLVKPGGFYVVDDMLPQPNWPEGHQEKVDGLIGLLEAREDLYLTKLKWSSGIIIAVKQS